MGEIAPWEIGVAIRLWVNLCSLLAAHLKIRFLMQCSFKIIGQTTYDTIFFSEEISAIKMAVCLPFTEVQRSVDIEIKAYTPIAFFKDNWRELYEERMNAYNKIVHACEVADPVTVLFAAAELMHEIEEASAFTEVESNVLPDVIVAYNPKGLSLFEKAAKEQNAALEHCVEKRCSGKTVC